MLRLCSVFEPPPSALVGKGLRFDPVGRMQNHTAELTRAFDRRGVLQTVLTTRPPTAPTPTSGAIRDGGAGLSRGDICSFFRPLRKQHYGEF